MPTYFFTMQRLCPCLHPQPPIPSLRRASKPLFKRFPPLVLHSFPTHQNISPSETHFSLWILVPSLRRDMSVLRDCKITFRKEAYSIGCQSIRTRQGKWHGVQLQALLHIFRLGGDQGDFFYTTGNS